MSAKQRRKKEQAKQAARFVPHGAFGVKSESPEEIRRRERRRRKIWQTWAVLISLFIISVWFYEMVLL